MKGFICYGLDVCAVQHWISSYHYSDTEDRAFGRQSSLDTFVQVGAFTMRSLLLWKKKLCLLKDKEEAIEQALLLLSFV